MTLTAATSVVFWFSNMQLVEQKKKQTFASELWITIAHFELKDVVLGQSGDVVEDSVQKTRDQ